MKKIPYHIILTILGLTKKKENTWDSWSFQKIKLIAIRFLVSNMLVTMSERGPDSSGLAIYKKGKLNKIKMILRSENPFEDLEKLQKEFLLKQKLNISLEQNSNHIILTINKKDFNDVEDLLKKSFSTISIMSSGETIEIFKEVGLPKNLIKRFNISDMSGTHCIGHTRMATECCHNIRSPPI